MGGREDGEKDNQDGRKKDKIKRVREVKPGDQSDNWRHGWKDKTR